MHSEVSSHLPKETTTGGLLFELELAKLELDFLGVDRWFVQPLN